MTDDLARGLGALEDSTDPRDYPIDALYAAEDTEPVPLDALPASFRISQPRPEILDQGSSPMCVAYSSAWQKAWADRRDMLRWFDFNEPLFFHQIGGTEKGAEVRWAMQRMVDSGYPVTGVPGSADDHRIAAYYRIDAGPDMAREIKQALATFGCPLVLSIAWFRSWAHPRVDGTLPPPDDQVGGHAIDIIGWRPSSTPGAVVDFLLPNTWGTDWGEQGYCWLPDVYLVHARAAWRAVDVIEHPVPYRKTVRTRDRVRLRRAPKTNAEKLGLIPDGAQLSTRQLERYGGKYTGPHGASRTDWLQVVHAGHVGWVARAYTKVVK